MPRFITCIDCGTLADATRCDDCRTRANRVKKAKRPDLHTAAWRKLRAEAISAQPWCTRCRATGDLTLDHVVAGSTVGGVQVLCRPCNSSKGAGAGEGGGHPRDGF